MYERSAIVLEKYFDKILGLDKKTNLKTNFINYKELVEEIDDYQKIIKDEDKIIDEFDEIANEIRRIQQEQKRLYKSNLNLEEDRNQLFDSLDDDLFSIESKLKKIEEAVKKNNENLEDLRGEFIEALEKFNEKQKERNKYSKNRRAAESKHIQIIEKCDKCIKEIQIEEVRELKDFATKDVDVESEIIARMVENGKDEKIPFNKGVIENAVKLRCEIAKKEAESYIIIFDKVRRLLSEINREDINVDKYKKSLRDNLVKLNFFEAEKNYITSFLDNERMTIISGPNVHKELMEEACKSFEQDKEQFQNLYELLLKEIAGKSTKKAYNELYNKEYLKNIEEKDLKFQKEANNIKINTATILNSNYWRIEQIRNIYEVFQQEVTEKFGKDMTEFKLEIAEVLDVDEDIMPNVSDEIQKDLFKRDRLKEVEKNGEIDIFGTKRYDEILEPAEGTEEYFEDYDDEEYFFEDDDDDDKIFSDDDNGDNEDNGDAKNNLDADFDDDFIFSEKDSGVVTSDKDDKNEENDFIIDVDDDDEQDDTQDLTTTGKKRKDARRDNIEERIREKFKEKEEKESKDKKKHKKGLFNRLF